MRRKKRPFWLLVISLLSLGLLIYLIVSFPPNGKLQTLSHGLAINHIFFISLFLFIFSSIAYLLNNIRRGLFFGLFVISFFLLRLFQLTHPFFLILLLALLLTLDLLFSRKK